MEKKCVDPRHEQANINLKNLPPINPPNNSTPNFQVKKSRTITRYVPKVANLLPEAESVKVVKFDHEANTEADLLAEQEEEEENDGDASSVCCIKHIDYNNLVKNTQSKLESDDGAFVESGELKRVSARSHLHGICASNNWKPPLYECCREEGPSHLRLFTFKAVVEIEEAECMFLECYSAPMPKKKTAAEHAAEGALWYLTHLGYFPINKKKKKTKKNKNKKEINC